MSGFEVNVVEINQLDDLDNAELIQAVIDDFEENGTYPQFLISPEAFDSISPATARETLAAFLTMFFSCKKLFFLASLPKPLIGYIRHILQTFMCMEKPTSIVFVSTINHPPCDVEKEIVSLRAHINSCKLNRQRTITKKNINPQVHGVHLEQLRDDDELCVFANFLACPDDEFMQEFIRSDRHSAPYAAESDTLAYFLENYEIDEQRYLRYIGFVHEKAVEIMFQNDRPINQKLIDHIVHTWMNACMGIIRTCDERIFNARPSVVLPDPLPETASDWMMQTLEDYLVTVMAKNMLDVVEVKFGSMPQFLHDWDIVREHCQPLLDRAAMIMPFVAFEDVVDAITDFYIHAAIAWLFVSAYQSDESGFKGLLFVYQNLSDRVLETIMITPKDRAAARYAVTRLVLYLKYTPPEQSNEKCSYPVCVPLANPVIYVSQYVQRMMRQTIEYRRTTLAACQEIEQLPFVVQGESFVMPMTSAYYSSASRVLRTDAFFALVSEARPAIGDHVVQLPSQFHFFNKPDELQHDYLFAHEKWADDRPGTPDVFTAIINTSMVEMRFKFTRTGRAAPLLSLKKKSTEGTTPDDVILQPGHLFIYKREALRGKDNTLFSWQCRLSECLRKLESGVTFMQTSIAVFRAGNFNQFQIDEIKSTVKLMYRGGVVKNWLYTGKQGFEKGNRRRLPYPALYSQLTNAVKENTRMRFFENWAFMQRDEIKALFSQSVVLCSDEKTNEMRLITPKKNGRAYDERRGYEYRFQKMSFERIIEHTPAIWKKQVNTSVGRTKAFCKDLYSKEEPQRLSFIYSNSPPPLRNLVGLLETKSEEYVAKTRSPGWELNFFGAEVIMRDRQERQLQQ